MSPPPLTHTEDDVCGPHGTGRGLPSPEGELGSAQISGSGSDLEKLFNHKLN